MPSNNDPFPWGGSQPLDPALPPYRGAAVVPSDTVDLAFIARQLFCTGAGNVVVLLLDGVTQLTLPVGANSFLPHDLLIRRVFNTLTTATGITALA